ncbi:hypothetical protein ACWY4P_00745 [Streptomyces sp. LZ34]
MKPIVSTHDHQAPRRGATLWSRLHGAFRMLCLLAVGVVALGVTANATPAKRQVGQVSDPVTTIELKQIVATEKAVYALAADQQGVYEWSTRQDGWLKVFGPAKNLYAGGDSVYATDLATGNLHKYIGRPGEWTRIGGPGACDVPVWCQWVGVSDGMSDSGVCAGGVLRSGRGH